MGEDRLESAEEVHDFGFEKTGPMKNMIVKKARGLTFPFKDSLETFRTFSF